MPSETAWTAASEEKILVSTAISVPAPPVRSK